MNDTLPKSTPSNRIAVFLKWTIAAILISIGLAVLTGLMIKQLKLERPVCHWAALGIHGVTMLLCGIGMAKCNLNSIKLQNYILGSIYLTVTLVANAYLYETRIDVGVQFAIAILIGCTLATGILERQKTTAVQYPKRRR